VNEISTPKLWLMRGAFALLAPCGDRNLYPL